jgi:anti-sigma B factor antagonist
MTTRGDLQVNLEFHGDEVVVVAVGEIDAYTTRALREKLIEATLPFPDRILVDLRGVTFLDSTGIGVLVSALKRVSVRQQKLELVCDAEHILKVLDVMGLRQVFVVHETHPIPNRS